MNSCNENFDLHHQSHSVQINNMSLNNEHIECSNRLLSSKQSINGKFIFFNLFNKLVILII